MSNLSHFPRQRLDDETENTASPDPVELQRILGDIAESIRATGGRRNDWQIRIRNFRSDRFQLVDDLLVCIEERAGQYLANSYDTGQYGHGYSPDDAIQHLCSVLEDYYDLLLEDEGHLSPSLDSHLDYLRSILRDRK